MTIAKKTGGRPSKRPTNAELAMLYSVMTAKEIEERFDVSVYTVRNSDCNGNALKSKFNY